MTPREILPVTSRSTQIILAILLSLLFSVQAFGYTMPIHSQLPGDAGCEMPVGMDEGRCGMSASASSENEPCVDTEAPCQMGDECSMSHCSVGSAITISSTFAALWVSQGSAFMYTSSSPVSYSSSLYKPPIA